jgi:hypothetical protein
VDAVKLVFVALSSACTITSIEKPSSTTEGAPADSITISALTSDGAVAQVKVDVVVDGLPAALGKDDVLRLADGLGATAPFTGEPGDFEAKLATADTALVIQLVRSGAVAKTTPIPLPPAFAPNAPASASRASGISLTWAAAPSFPMEIVATGPECLPPDGFTAHLEPDTGAFEIQPADIGTTPGPCTITIAFTRGTGNTQTRTVTVPTTP